MLSTRWMDRGRSRSGGSHGRSLSTTATILNEPEVYTLRTRARVNTLGRGNCQSAGAAGMKKH